MVNMPPPPDGQPPAGPPPWPSAPPRGHAPWQGPPPPHWPTTPHGAAPQYSAPWTHPTPPPRPGPTRNWLLIGLALLAAIAVGVAATLALTHRGASGEKGGRSSTTTGDIASANDTGPVGIITDEPTCGRWTEIDGQLASQVNTGQASTDWGKRDASIPATAWTAQQRQMFESAAGLFKAEADQLVALARQTPHRVVREIYTQIIAYNRAYAEAIPSYTPIDDQLALTRNDLGATINAVCASIDNFAAAKRATTVAPATPPTARAPIGDLAAPERFITAPSSTCSSFLSSLERMATKLEAWYKTDPRIPAAQRSPADTVIYDMAASVFNRSADEWEQLGRESGNPVTEDFLVMGAQYLRAYSTAVPTYVPADEKLYQVARHIGAVIKGACQAVQR